MSRRPVKIKRDLPSDIKYNSVLVQRFINKINYRGKKSLAMKIVYGAFDKIKEKMNEEPLKIFTQAIENARPLVELKPRRIGGATYQVPVEVPQYRGETLAIRWIIQYAKEKKGKPMKEKLAEEIIAAYKKENSLVIKRREDTHKMAEANRAFAHYRW
ncbi:MAG: 30S ribosomal protein S7 [Candidatus Omnitrophica bacterium]|nr:30S ribosomal protein S7 [Candidatus Omnitrophota bacterium]